MDKGYLQGRIFKIFFQRCFLSYIKCDSRYLALEKSDYCKTTYLSAFQVGKRSNFKRTSCECSKLTANAKSVGGGLTVPTINPIDFRNIFTNFLSLLQANPTVFATIITILAVYFLLAVWARRSDKADIERVRSFVSDKS